MATSTKTQNDTIVSRAKAIGQNIVDLQKSSVRLITLTDALQTEATALRTEGVKFGKSVKTCTWRQTIADTIVSLAPEKTAQKTCMNYVTSFVKAVNDGTPFSLSDSKGKAKGKGKGKTKTEALDVLIAKVFSHGDFANLFSMMRVIPVVPASTMCEQSNENDTSAFFGEMTSTGLSFNSEINLLACDLVMFAFLDSIHDFADSIVGSMPNNDARCDMSVSRNFICAGVIGSVLTDMVTSSGRLGYLNITDIWGGIGAGY